MKPCNPTDGQSSSLYFPTDLECAVMSNLAYLSAENQKKFAPYGEEKDAQDLNSYVQCLRDKGWEFVGLHEGTDGYYGSLYVNHRTRCVVLSHRGTVPSNFGSLKTDLCSILKGQVNDTSQVSAAIAYCKKVLSRPFNGNLISDQLKDYQLVLTGHSLGGWLAEICAWECYRKFHISAHTVTFESPGSLPALKKLAENHVVDFATIHQLDVINYLAAPNLINTCNLHIGEMRRIFPDAISTSSIGEWIGYTAHQHAMNDILRAFNKDSGLPEKMHLMRDWPHLALSTNDYSEFHELVKKENMYSPTFNNFSFEIQFKLEYKAHYLAEQFRANELALVHFHPQVERFLRKYKKYQLSFLAVVKDKLLQNEFWENFCKIDYEIIDDIGSVGKKILKIKIPQIAAISFQRDITNFCYQNLWLLGQLEKHIKTQHNLVPSTFLSQPKLLSWHLPEKNSRVQCIFSNINISQQNMKTDAKLEASHVQTDHISRYVLLQTLTEQFNQGVDRQVLVGAPSDNIQEVAVQYARYQKEMGKYDFIAWIEDGGTADNNLLGNQLKDFARVLDVISNPQETPAQFGERLRKKLANYPCVLLVINNTSPNHLNLLKTYLPDMEFDHHRLHIILISHVTQNWPPTLSLISVKSYLLDEAISYLCYNTLPTCGEAQARQVAELSQRSPTVLSNIINHLNQVPCASLDSLSDYLKRYREQGENHLLTTKLLDVKKEDQDMLSVKQSWQMLIDQLNATGKQLLYCCAYLATEQIPQFLLEEGFYPHAHGLFELSIAQLSKYSLLKYDASSHNFSIDMTLSPIVRESLSEGERKAYIKSVLEVLIKLFTKDTRAKEDTERDHALLPHIDAICQYAAYYANEDSSIAFQIARLLNVKAYFYTQIGMATQGAEEISEQAKHYCDVLAGISEGEFHSLLQIGSDQESKLTEDDTLSQKTQAIAGSLYEKLTSPSSHLPESERKLLPILYASILYTYGRMYFYTKNEATKTKSKVYLYVSKWLSKVISEKTGEKIFYEILADRNGLLYFYNQKDSAESTLLQGIARYKALLQDTNTYANEDAQQIALAHDQFHQMTCHRQIIDICKKLGHYNMNVAHEYVDAMVTLCESSGDRWERIAAYYNVAGNFFLESQKYEEAERYFTKAMQTEESKNAGKGKMDYPLADAYQGLGELYLRTTSLQQAKCYFEKVREVYKVMKFADTDKRIEGIKDKIKEIEQRLQSEASEALDQSLIQAAALTGTTSTLFVKEKQGENKIAKKFIEGQTVLKPVSE